MSLAMYEVLQSGGRSVVIRDVGGPRDRSVTNDAETVVDELFQRGLIREGVQLYYYDSTGKLDRILHSGGVFVGFAPGPSDGVVSS